MRDLFPQPPDWRVRWMELDATLECVGNLRGCHQNPERHPEGDVWIHVRMVCEVLAADPAWRALPPAERDIVFAGALLHDAGKPFTTRKINGRLRSTGHAARGAILARRLLWEWGWPFDEREAAAALVRHHSVPGKGVDDTDSRRRVYFASQTARCDWLAMVARADVLGRTGPRQSDRLDNIDRFRRFAKRGGCLEGPRGFPSDHARFLYFFKESHDPDARPADDTHAEVTILSGLPGAGKDTWIRENARKMPVVGPEAPPDAHVAAAENNAYLVAAARNVARKYLRARRPFVWNAANLTRKARMRIAELAASYGARVKIVSIEASPDEIHERNLHCNFPILPGELDSLINTWELPDRTEAHTVEYVGIDNRRRS